MTKTFNDYEYHIDSDADVEINLNPDLDIYLTEQDLVTMLREVHQARSAAKVKGQHIPSDATHQGRDGGLYYKEANGCVYVATLAGRWILSFGGTLDGHGYINPLSEIQENFNEL